jgi:AcrR family transcriptional regulator
LDAAEQLFAERGFEGVSIRDLSTAAGVNVAAVNYHFQGKKNLYLSVLIRRLKPIREGALKALAQVTNQGRDPSDPRTLIRTFVKTYLQEALTRPGGVMFLRLMARQMADPRHGGEVFFQELVIPVHEAFAGALAKALPQLDADRIRWIIASIVGQVLHFVMRWQRGHFHSDLGPGETIPQTLFPPLAQPLDQYIQQVVDHITRFSAGGIEAMIHQATREP